MRAAALASIALALLTATAGVPAATPPVFASAVLAAAAFAHGTEAEPCPGAAATRFYDIVALRVPVSYNHWGDFDPEGRLFVLASQEQALLADVAQKLAAAGLDAAARALADPAGELQYAIPAGVGGQPHLEPFDVSSLAQPLVVRARVGECVQLNLTNRLPEPVSIGVERAQARPGDGMALGANEPDLALPGETRAYVVYIPDLPGMEGAHFLSSRADPRFHTKHGLFGAIVAEPADASWAGPDGQALDSGQEAIITRPGAADFREYVVILHDEVELLDRNLNPLPILSPYGEYGPGTKAINLRTEPFMDRFKHHDQLFNDGEVATAHDKSQGYGSYTYGDPAHFLPRAYVGDPTKFRLLNAGPGQHHVFHLHGGGDRWRASPVSDDTQFDRGLTKVNPVVRSASERIDVQLVGPGESYNLEIEGGAGGVQQSVGDFLYHCHIVEHYVAGMFAFWRVHNTLQDGLAELPDRAGRVAAGVTSAQLVGRTMPDGTTIAPGNLEAWVAGLLPPRGVPTDDDASVWDWALEEGEDGRLLAKGEPESLIAFPNHASDAPGERPILRFNPHDGRLAFPFLQPHFGKRPPFAPGHGPAPHLGLTWDAQHPDGLCPAGAPPRDYRVVALSVPVAYNARDVDPDGQVFVHAEDKAAVLGGTKAARNLIVRANQGDCVDVTLTSQLAEPEGSHSKVNMHIHLVQFDVQASDGVITGFNYEQSVRPAATTGSALAAAVPAGFRTIDLADAGFLADAEGAPKVGSALGIGLTEPTVELRTVVAVAGTVVTLDAPLEHAHGAGERVGYEFVRYRWYPDVELGMVYWHDHVDGLNSWRHGLFGGLVVEPAGSSWRDPKTGAELREGTVADIVGPNGTFRELVAELQDRSWPIGDEGRELASFNLRSAPFDARALNPLSSGGGNGDPATDILRAYPGDPVVIRLLWGANANSRAVGTFGVQGHRFPVEWNLPTSRVVDAISFGISAQHNLHLACGAGGCARLPGDYLYHMTQPDLFERGAWGVLRVHDAPQGDLLPLPGVGYGVPGSLPTGPVRRYDVVAMSADVVYNDRFDVHAATKLFALASEAGAIANGTLRPHPLVIRALPGETVEVALTNDLDEPVSLHAGLVLSDPADVPVGANAGAVVPPGGTRTYRWFADRELGAAYLTSLAHPTDDAIAGLYGALVVEPAGAAFSPGAGMSADLTLAGGEAVREHVLLYASDDPLFQSGVMPYTVDVRGIASVNYRTEPLHARLGGRVEVPGFHEPAGGLGLHSCQVNSETCLTTLGPAASPKSVRFEARHPAAALVFAETPFGAPETPILDAAEGQRVVVRAIGAAGDQLQVHRLAGHWWARDGGAAGAAGEVVNAATLGPREVSNAWTIAGPAGPGDYLWGSHRLPFAEAGAWGLLRAR